MHLWIPGCKGMLGTALMQACHKHKIPCLGTSKEEVDIQDVDAVLSFAKERRFTHIINCAAYTQVDLAETEKETAFSLNALGPENLAKAARKQRCQLLHVSTDYVFDGNTKTPYTESADPHPLNQYGLSKWEGEKRLQEILPTACIVRTSWLFGQSGANFVRTMLRLMQERETLSIVADQKSRPTYAPDLANALLTLVDAQGTYHFANQGEVSWYEFAQAIYKEATAKKLPLSIREIFPIPTKDYPLPATRPSLSTLCTKKIETNFRLNPRPYTTALEECIS